MLHYSVLNTRSTSQETLYEKNRFCDINSAYPYPSVPRCNKKLSADENTLILGYNSN